MDVPKPHPTKPRPAVTPGGKPTGVTKTPSVWPPVSLSEKLHGGTPEADRQVQVAPGSPFAIPTVLMDQGRIPPEYIAQGKLRRLFMFHLPAKNQWDAEAAVTMIRQFAGAGFVYLVHLEPGDSSGEGYVVVMSDNELDRDYVLRLATRQPNMWTAI